jgi:hypothetical protein
LANLLPPSHPQTFYRTPKDDKENLGDHGFGIRHTSKSTVQERKNKLDFVKIDLCSMKNTAKITKRESTHCDKIFANITGNI